MILFGLIQLACSSEDGGSGVPEPPAWPEGRLVSAAVMDDGAILIAAEHGEIHRSEDAGETWRRARGPAVKSISALSMADTQVGWAVGDGVILKTDDAGLAWRRQRLPRRADEVQLMGVAAVDLDRAIAVGADGLRFYTQDGGAVWKDASNPLVAPSRESVGRAMPHELFGALHDDLHDVACEAEGLNRCWAVGAGLYVSRDLGVSWEPVPVSHFDSTEPIEFAFSGVEISEKDAERIRALATKWRYVSALSWRIEVALSASEVERIGGQRDFAALLEIVEARAQETRSILEDAGIETTRIETLGAPPWNYEDSLDEDPELLERYFSERMREVGSVRIHLDDHARLHALALAEEGHAIAVGEAGKVARRVRTQDGGFAWKVEGRNGKQDLFGVALGSEGRPVLVGAQGGFWLTDVEYDADQPADYAQRGAVEGPGTFGAIRDIAFGRGAEPKGVAGGELGRIWTTEGIPPEWRVRTSPDSADGKQPAGVNH